MAELRDMSDEELDAHRKDVLKEIERRDRLEEIPDQIDRLRSEYENAGGNLGDLKQGA